MRGDEVPPAPPVDPVFLKETAIFGGLSDETVHQIGSTPLRALHALPLLTALETARLA